MPIYDPAAPSAPASRTTRFGDPIIEATPAAPTPQASQRTTRFGDPVLEIPRQQAPMQTIAQPAGDFNELARQAILSRQGRGINLTPSDKAAIIQAYRQQYAGAAPQQTYEEMSQQVRGVAAQQANPLENFGGAAAENLARTGLGLVGVAAPDTARQLEENLGYTYDPASLAAKGGALTGNVLSSFAAAGVPGGAALLAASAAGNFRSDVAKRRLAGQQVSVPAELAGAVGYGLAEYVGERFGLGSIQKLSKSALKGAAKDFLYQYAKTAGINASEEMVTQVAQNAIDKGLLGDSKSLLEGVGEAGLMGAAAGVIGGGAHAALSKFQVRSREGPSKGQPVEFASVEDKARFIKDNPGYRGNIKQIAEDYVNQLESGGAQAGEVKQVLAGEKAPTPTPTPENAPALQPATARPTVGTSTDLFSENAKASALEGQPPATERRTFPRELASVVEVAKFASQADPDVKSGELPAGDVEQFFAGELSKLNGGEGKFTLVNLPLDIIETAENYQPENVKKYKKQSAETAPPVIGGFEGDNFVLVDGNTRVKAANERGDTTIKAYIPEDSAKQFIPSGQDLVRQSQEARAKAGELRTKAGAVVEQFAPDVARQQEQKKAVQQEQTKRQLAAPERQAEIAKVTAEAVPVGEQRPRPLSLRTETKEGRQAYIKEDIARKEAGIPAIRSDDEVKAKANELLKGGDKAIDALIAKGNSGESYTDTETAAVSRVIDDELPKAYASKDVRKIARLGLLVTADRRAGTEQGRAFRQRRDPVTPAQRLRRALAEAISTPPVVEGKEVTRTDEATHLRRIREHFEKNGKLGEMTEENLADPVWVSRALNEISTLNPKANPIYEYFLSSILSGPLTQGRNLIGNVTNFALNQIALRPVEQVINSFVRDPKAAQFGEWKYIFKGMAPRLQAAWTNAIQSFNSERAIFQGRVLDPHSEISGPAIKGLKGRIIRTPLRLLTAVDQFMKTVVGMGEVGARAFRDGKEQGLKPGSTEMEEYISKQMEDLDSPSWVEAYEYAKKVAFQDKPGPLTSALSNLREVPFFGVHPLRYVVLGPFLRIAGKLESATWDYTPLGSARIAGRTLSGAYKGNHSLAVQDLAKQALAWSTFAALWGMIGDEKKEPWITGSVSKEAKDFAYRTAPPMSIKLPGYGWVSYKHLQPLSGAISTSIDTISAIKQMKSGTKEWDAAVSEFLEKTKNRIVDQTFLSSLSDFAEAMDSSDKATNFLVNFGSSWVPNLIRQPMYQADNKIRQGKRLENTEVIDMLKRRALPGVFKALPRVTPWGEEITKPGNSLERMLTPFTRFGEEVNPIDGVIAKWNRENPAQPFYPSVPSPDIKVGEKMEKLTEEEYYLTLRVGGLIAGDALRKTAPVKNQLATATTIELIKDVRSKAGKRVNDLVRAAVFLRVNHKDAQYKEVMGRLRSMIDKLETP